MVEGTHRTIEETPRAAWGQVDILDPSLLTTLSGK